MPSTHADPAITNGHDDIPHPTTPGKKAPGAAKGKKAAAKSTSDEATRLLQARISQLEQDATNEKDQEMEIGEYSATASTSEGQRRVTRHQETSSYANRIHSFL